LDDDHYGLFHVKKRLLQYLSVLKLHETNELSKLSEASSNPPSSSSSSSASDDQLIIGNYQEVLDEHPRNEPTTKVSKPTKNSIKSPILLFVGPPGVGKTSLAKSIADSLGRKFQRVSLGGIRDESEIRGHRRTYVGSLPGVIINALRKAGSMNPLILLDEIDKVCGGANSAGRVNGDPEAALLEVLDPEQNWSFTDHYIGFPVDLSNVLFLCTANELGSISAPLRDRMEVIEISGYTFEEKLQIGSRFLLPKQIKQNGLPPKSVVIEHNIWEKLIQEYIREAGVRNLERKIAAICRGKAVEYVQSNGNDVEFVKNVEPNKLVKYLGLPIHPITKDILTYPKFSKPQGVVNGLSYSSDGSGSVLVFEIIAIPSLNAKQESDSPKLIMTGRLGETLTESIKIGLTFIKSIISRNLIISINSREVLKTFNNSELHLHVPMGSVPKDGPSAGITITLALLSIALNKPVPGYIAMTGEITLRGKVLPIGGLGEKLLGASQNGIKKVLVPKLNRKDIIETFYNDDEDKLIGFLKDGVVVDGYGEPEKKVKDKLDIEIVYVDSFFDVIKAVWGDEVVINDHQVDNHL
jgi:ATP-dependent Lon protease